MKKRNNPVLNVYFIFTGAKDEKRNQDWSETIFDDDKFNIHILPSKEDLLDFEYLMPVEGVENMIEDFNTTIFKVVSRTFIPISSEGENYIRLTFALKPYYNLSTSL